MEINASLLEGTGLSRSEIQEVLGCPGEEARLKRLQSFRGSLLSEIHTRQQTIDNLDRILRGGPRRVRRAGRR